MNVDRMRRYVRAGNGDAIERAEALARFHGGIGRKMMGKRRRQEHRTMVRRFLDQASQGGAAAVDPGPDAR